MRLIIFFFSSARDAENRCEPFSYLWNPKTNHRSARRLLSSAEALSNVASLQALIDSHHDACFIINTREIYTGMCDAAERLSI